MSQLRALLLPVAIAFLSVGCGTEPIPGVAVAGTTITIPVPNEFGSFGLVLSDAMEPNQALLYQSLPKDEVPYDATSPLEDPQRGELVFALFHDDAVGALRTFLPVRYVTRVHLDEGSPAASPASGETAAGAFASDGQVIAFVDIPEGVGEGPYKIRVLRYLREEGHTSSHDFLPAQPQLENGNWQGWGSGDPEGELPLYVVGAVETSPGEGTDNTFDATGWGNFFGYLWSEPLDDHLPAAVARPKIVLTIGDAIGESGPAALDFELEYPRHRIEIVGVDLKRNDRSSAIVLWEPDPQGEAACDASETTGSIKIHVLDPEEKTAQLRVAYRLLNFEDPDPNCGMRLATEDLHIKTGFKAYDRDGVEIASYSGPVISNVAF